jgi:hypothetical protein
MTTSIRTNIFIALEAQVRTLPWVTSVEWKRIRVSPSDIQPHEVPLVQMFAQGSSFEHQQGRIQETIGLSVELILRKSDTAEVDQVTLFDYLEELELCFGSKITLGVPEVINMIYTGNVVDLHMIDPFYYARLDFDIVLRRPFTGCF